LTLKFPADFSCITSPSEITAAAWLRMARTFSSPVSTINSKARLSRKSPTSTLAWLPQTMLAETLPRRSELSSTTSSCRQGGGVDELDRRRQLGVMLAG
jgi:hypothetical protein